MTKNQHMSTPRHIALIPDGNRRWAREQGHEPWHGHEKGAECLEEILEYACMHRIEYLSVWGSSRANLDKRPLREKRELIKVYERYFLKLMNSEIVQREGIQVSVIGLWKQYLPQPMINLIERVMGHTEHHTKKRLTIMLAYSGDEEMLGAINRLVREGGSVDAARLKSTLMTHDLPPVDLLIRTGGDPHMSTGFMMWDIADAEFFFTETLFPDFKKEMFEEALNDFSLRRRRLGA